jgi:hypothetical protein
MKASNEVVNNAFARFPINIDSREAWVRLGLAGIFAGLPLVVPNPHFLIGFVVVSVYLFTTAITRLEPVYYLVEALKTDHRPPNAATLLNGKIPVNPARRDGQPAANDMPGAYGDLKETA